MADCSVCGRALGAKNKTGLCRVHFNQQPVSEATREKRSRSMIRRLAVDPELRERRRSIAADAARRPEVRAARSTRAKEQRLWERAFGKMTREQIDARNRAVSDAKLAHIPSDYRDEYRRIKRAGYKASEARDMIAEQQMADRARWRREWAS